MRQLLDCGTWHQQQLKQLAAFLTPTHTVVYFTAGTNSLLHRNTWKISEFYYSKELYTVYNYQAVMYLKKEISISFFITTISASNLYMPMIWSCVFLLDFLIPFLCGPDLQCGRQRVWLCWRGENVIMLEGKESDYAERVRLWLCRKAKSLIMLKGWRVLLGWTVVLGQCGKSPQFGQYSGLYTKRKNLAWSAPELGLLRQNKRR